MKTLTNSEITDIILATCVGCCSGKCQLPCIWPSLTQPLTKEEKENLKKHIALRLNIRAGKEQIIKQLEQCPDCNPAENDFTIGRCAPDLK